MSRVAYTLGLALLFAVPPAAAQQVPERWSLLPEMRLGSLGARWVREGEMPAELGPGTGPAFGAVVQLRPGGRLAWEAGGSVALTEYAVDFGPERIRGTGSLRQFRLHAGILYRMRANAPGYFSLGAGALYHSPGERVPGFQDEAQWMPSAHAGAGIDLELSGHTFRLDGRVHAVRPTQDELPTTSGFEPLEARTALDLLVSIGYLIPL